MTTERSTNSIADSSSYEARLEEQLAMAGLDRLAHQQQTFLRQQAVAYRFTQQELRQLCDIAADLGGQ